MLTYNLDISQNSTWLNCAPSEIMQNLGFYCTEAGTFYCNRAFETKRSDKNSYLLFFTFDGEGIIEQNGNRYVLKAGSLALLNCKTSHCYYTSPSEEKWSFHWAHINGTGVCGYDSLLSSRGVPHQIIMHKEIITESFHVLFKLLNSPEAQKGLEVCYRIHTMLTLLAQEQFEFQHQNSKSAAELCSFAAQQIANNYSQSINLDSLAEETHISKSYLIRIFKNFYGTTPYEFLLNTRIKKAKELLLSTALSVCEISEIVGFASSNNFITQFKRICNQSPLQYRKMFD